MNLVVQRARIYARPIRTPRNRSNRTPELVHAHRMLRTLISSLPHTDCTVVSTCDDELDSSASCESSVEGIDDTTVGVQSTHTLAGRQVDHIQRMIRRNGVHELRCERPLEVEHGGFVYVRDETVVCVWGVCTP